MKTNGPVFSKLKNKSEKTCSTFWKKIKNQNDEIGYFFYYQGWKIDGDFVEIICLSLGIFLKKMSP